MELRSQVVAYPLRRHLARDLDVQVMAQACLQGPGLYRLQATRARAAAASICKALSLMRCRSLRSTCSAELYHFDAAPWTGQLGLQLR